MTFRGLTTVMGAMILLASSAASGAEPSPDQLFEEARVLMHDGRFQEASQKLAESEAREPTPVTLLNLGLCHQKLGRRGSALLELREVVEEAGKDVDLANLAKEDVREIEAQLDARPLPRLKIDVNPAAASQGVSVSIDGIWLKSSLFADAIPADVGDHVVVARDARGRASRATVHTHDLATEAVNVLFEDASGPRVMTGAVDSPPATTLSTSSTLTKPPPPPARPTHLYLLGAAGACLIGATVTGVIAHEERATFLQKNGDPNASTADRTSAHDTAESWQWANLAFVVGTAVAAGAALYVYMHRPSETQPVVTPVVTRDSLGFAVSMRWGGP